MSLPKNPFHTLYLTERVGDVDFPAIFSPILIPYVLPLFQPGNVVIRGMQGTGKSMLLALLQSDVRLSFYSGGVQYPVPSELSRFVSASINLSASNAWKLNERSFDSPDEEEVKRSQAAFADYLNTWIVRDLLLSVRALVDNASPEIAEVIGISRLAATLDKAVALLAGTESCAGMLVGCLTLSAAADALSSRLRHFVDFVNFNTDITELNSRLRGTFTVIGEPIAAAGAALREAGAIRGDVEVIVTIDQFEELQRLEQTEPIARKYGRFREVVDRLISLRQRSVSYRLGTRPYAMHQMGHSEPLRDYVVLDLDDIMRRREHSKTLVFPRFAEDVLCRRLFASRQNVEQKGLMQLLFGASPKGSERAALSVRTRPEKAIRVDPKWPKPLRIALQTLAAKDVLSAKLCGAWIRQQLAAGIPMQRLAGADLVGQQPWNRPEKRWWKKERIPQAVLQIASANRQRVPYLGYKDILSLSGDNILVFASICRQIWECWIRTLRQGEYAVDQLAHPFERLRQEEGIRSASSIWHDAVAASPRGNTIQRLLDTIGLRLNRQLIEDERMSYPGANGFSLSDRDLASDREVRNLLRDATALGFLQQRPHTPKAGSRGKSTKWYTHPIFAPYYEITVPHTKEPLYLTVRTLRQWLERGKVLRSSAVGRRKPRRHPRQKTLFDSSD
jgi:hypothetical protein